MAAQILQFRPRPVNVAEPETRVTRSPELLIALAVFKALPEDARRAALQTIEQVAEVHGGEAADAFQLVRGLA